MTPDNVDPIAAPSGAVTIDGTRYLYRPVLHFIGVGLMAAFIALIVFWSSDAALGPLLRPEQLVLALLTSGIFAGLAASALATARVALLPLLIGPPLTLAVYTLQDLYASTAYPAALLSAALVAWALAMLCQSLVASDDEAAALQRLRRQGAGLAAVLGSAIPLLILQPEPVFGFLSSNRLHKPTGIVLTAAIYAGLGLACAVALRRPWWRRPAPGPLVVLGSGSLAWLTLYPTLWMWHGVATGQHLSGSDLDTERLVGPMASWYALALSAAFLYFCALYLLGSWRRAYPASPEQARQAQQALGIFGLLALILGAAYLKGAPERRRRAEAWQHQQDREWKQVIDGLNASVGGARPAKPAPPRSTTPPGSAAPKAPASISQWELEQRREEERQRRRQAEEQAEIERRRQAEKQDRFMRATREDERKAEDLAQRQRDLRDG